MHVIAGITALIIPVILWLLAPFISGQLFSNQFTTSIGQLGRTFLAANTVYVLALYAIMWAFTTAPQYAGPAANVGGVVGVVIITLILTGKSPTLEIFLATAVLVAASIWMYYALGRA